MAEMGPRSVSNIVFIVLLAGTLVARRHAHAAVHLGRDERPLLGNALTWTIAEAYGASSTPPWLRRAPSSSSSAAPQAAFGKDTVAAGRPARSSSRPARPRRRARSRARCRGAVSGSAAPVFSASEALRAAISRAGEVQHRVGVGLLALDRQRQVRRVHRQPGVRRGGEAAHRRGAGPGHRRARAVAAGAAGVGGDGEGVLQPLERHVARRAGRARRPGRGRSCRAWRSAPRAARWPCAGRRAPCGSGSG